MFYILALLLAVTFVLPIISKKVEKNFELLVSFKQLGIYIVPGIVILGAVGSWFGKQIENKIDHLEKVVIEETTNSMIIRALKMFFLLLHWSSLEKCYANN